MIAPKFLPPHFADLKRTGYLDSLGLSPAWFDQLQADYSAAARLGSGQAARKSLAEAPNDLQPDR